MNDARYKIVKAQRHIRSVISVRFLSELNFSLFFSFRNLKSTENGHMVVRIEVGQFTLAIKLTLRINYENRRDPIDHPGISLVGNARTNYLHK